MKADQARFDTRLSLEQKMLFEKAALIGGFRSLTDFVLSVVQEKAKEIISEKETTLISQRDSELFFDALLHPEKPNKALLEATKHYNKRSAK